MEVSEAPPIQKALEQGTLPLNAEAFPTITPQDLEQMSFAEVQSIFIQVIQEISQKYKAQIPNLQATIEAIAGPFARGSGTLKEQQVLSENQIGDSAREQQNMVHALYAVGNARFDSPFVQTMYGVVSMMESLCAKQDPMAQPLKNWWTGVKGQLAITKTLKEVGYEVNQPNYMNGTQSVLDWDVRSKIDMYARPSAKLKQTNPKAPLVCIDAKGMQSPSVAIKLEDPYELTAYGNGFHKLQPAVTRILEREDVHQINFATIRVSTADMWMAPLNRKLPPREALKKFATISHPQAKADLVKHLQKDTRAVRR
jgi:hypothetical protein